MPSTGYPIQNKKYNQIEGKRKGRDMSFKQQSHESWGGYAIIRQDRFETKNILEIKRYIL